MGSEMCIRDSLKSMSMLKEQKERNNDVFTGRQLLWKIFQHFKSSIVDRSLFDFYDLTLVHLKSDGLESFLMGYNAYGFGQAPAGRRIRESVQSSARDFSTILIYVRDVQTGDPDADQAEGLQLSS